MQVVYAERYLASAGGFFDLPKRMLAERPGLRRGGGRVKNQPHELWEKESLSNSPRAIAAAQFGQQHAWIGLDRGFSYAGAVGSL
jgi:hypothetical protein